MIGIKYTGCTHAHVDTSIHTHTHIYTHSCNSLTTFDSLIPRLRSFPPSLPPSLHPSFTDTQCILSLSTHASPTHTPLPLLWRSGTAVSEQARPLCRADRALIWGLMLGKKLIKGDRWERGRALSWGEKASRVSGLIGQGASGQLPGRDWVTWWLRFHTTAGCAFTHSLPWVCTCLMNSTLWSSELSRSWAKCASMNLPHTGKTRGAWWNFWNPSSKGNSAPGASTLGKRINWA